MRTIKAIHKAIYSPIDDLLTYRAMPTQSIHSLDPFLFLNHHGPQVYGPNNQGLPFGPHPHRGFETLTFVVKGDIMHWDSSGAKSVITEGGIQWMTAGSGLIHSEVSSEDFKKNGGEEEVLQLWMNLPAKYKMTPPKYQGLSREQIPEIRESDGNVAIHLISGSLKGKNGPIASISGLTMASIKIKGTRQLSLEVPVHHEILFYVVKGKLTINAQTSQQHELVVFNRDSEVLSIETQEDSYIIFGHGAPFNEPVVAHGPFVMNTQAEIAQAFQDYQSGKMGKW